MPKRTYRFGLRFGLIVSLSLSLSLSSILPPSIAKADTVFTIGSKQYIQNGETITMDATPQIVKDRTLLPVRYLAESCGADVTWDEKTKQVTLTKGEARVLMTIGSQKLLVNNKTTQMDVAPVIIKDRTMLPARWVAENLGWQVAWDETKRTVAIYPQQVSTLDNNLNLRQTPDTQGKVLGVLPQETVLAVEKNQNNWYQVKLPDGQTGWIAGWLTADSTRKPSSTVTLLPPASSAAANNSNSSGNSSNSGNNSTNSAYVDTNNSTNTAYINWANSTNNSNNTSNTSTNNSVNNPTDSTVSRGNNPAPKKMFQGLGVWTSIYTKLPNDQNLVQFKKGEINRIYLQVATSYRGFPEQWQDWIDELLPAAHRAGIQVIGWAYTDFEEPASDGELIARVSNYRTPSGDYLDGVCADIEEMPNDVEQAEEIIRQFTNAARKDLRDDCPLIAVTYPPQQRPNYPFAAMSKNFDAMVLMDYWHTKNREYTDAEVTEFIKQSVTVLKKAGCKVPIEVALQGCDIGAGMIAPSEMEAAVEATNALGIGSSIYTYVTPPEVWDAYVDSGN